MGWLQFIGFLQTCLFVFIYNTIDIIFPSFRVLLIASSCLKSVGVLVFFFHTHICIHIPGIYVYSVWMVIIMCGGSLLCVDDHYYVWMIIN